MIVIYTIQLLPYLTTQLQKVQMTKLGIVIHSSYALLGKALFIY